MKLVATYDHSLLPSENPAFDFRDQLVLSELHLFGSSRLGMIIPGSVKNRMLEASVSETPVTVYSDETNTIVEYLLTGIDYGELSGLVKENTGLFRITAGKKVYELTNHLGNVNVIISDQKIAIEGASGEVDYYAAEILYITDYYAFGSPMYGRDQQISEYRYGYNNMVRSMEINSYSTEYRELDTRIGRWWSVDLLANNFSWQSPYCSMDNNPIIHTDPKGLGTPEKYKIKKGDTFWSVENKFGIEHGKLQEWNSDMDPKKLKIGTEILLGPFGLNKDEQCALECSEPQFYDDDGRYTIRENSVAFAFGDKVTIMAEFTTGRGPTNSVFNSEHPLSKEVSKMYGIKEFMFKFVEKFNGKPSAGDSYTNYKGQFQTPEFIKSTFIADKTRHFIGSFTGNAFVDSEGKNVIFVIFDSKSATSLFERKVNEIQRIPYIPTPMGNTYQKYIFSIPLTDVIDLYNVHKEYNKNQWKYNVPFPQVH